MSFAEYPKAIRHATTGDIKIVKSAIEEQQMLEAGYERTGKSDPAAFIAATNHTPPDHVFDEYPKWVDGKRIEDPSIPPPARANEYPKWFNGKRVENEDEELDAIELDEEMAMPAAKRAEERAKLMDEAKKLGLDVDGRWGIERLRATVRGHTANHHRHADAGISR